MNNKDMISEVQEWVSKVVIDHQFCPFAKKEFVGKQIHYEVVESDDFESGLHALIVECKRLLADESTSTSLLIYPRGYESFDRYLDLYDLATALIAEQGYEGELQVASFHPDYCFEGEASDDAANYTNRSPYPILHLLDENVLEAALNSFPNPELIPDKNIDKARELGVEYFETLLRDIKKSS